MSCPNVVVAGVSRSLSEAGDFSDILVMSCIDERKAMETNMR